ncbi:MAG: TM0106 family RecB-like putative nuclease, partial [Aquiluna sp.]
MRQRADGWSFDSRDLMRSKCLHCTRLAVARELGIPGLQELINEFHVKPDNLPSRYGMAYEAELEQELLASLGDLVQQPSEQTARATYDLMDSGVPVIYQGVLLGGSGEMTFSGRPDFLLRSDYKFQFTDAGLTAIQVDGWRGGYSAWDAKLSSNPKVDYQNQVGLYVDVLQELGMAATGEHGLLLGNRTVAGFAKDVLLAQMIEARGKFLKQISDFRNEDPQQIADIGELVCEGTTLCDICEYPALCEHTRRETGHLQLVYGINKTQIEKLRRSGVNSVAELADVDVASGILPQEQLEKLTRQAKMQQRTYESGEHLYEVVNPELLASLPPESAGDIYFDIEGFTFGMPGGIEYLFGYTTVLDGEEFHWIWADSRAEEKQLFEKFMEDMLSRLDQSPGAHIYHYANYEKSALKRLAERHGVFQQEVQDLLSTGV